MLSPATSASPLATPAAATTAAAKPAATPDATTSSTKDTAVADNREVNTAEQGSETQRYESITVGTYQRGERQSSESNPSPPNSLSFSPRMKRPIQDVAKPATAESVNAVVVGSDGGEWDNQSLGRMGQQGGRGASGVGY